jgi:hypothetical protein
MSNYSKERKAFGKMIGDYGQVNILIIIFIIIVIINVYFFDVVFN